MYADYIQLLITPSISGQQTHVNVCETKLTNIYKSINAEKSFSIILFGLRFNFNIFSFYSPPGQHKINNSNAKKIRHQAKCFKSFTEQLDNDVQTQFSMKESLVRVLLFQIVKYCEE